MLIRKRVSYLYRTAQPSTLATFRSWGSLTGAGRIRLTRCKSTTFFNMHKIFFEKNISHVYQCIMIFSSVFLDCSHAENKILFRLFAIIIHLSCQYFNEFHVAEKVLPYYSDDGICRYCDNHSNDAANASRHQDDNENLDRMRFGAF